ncbi:hypothetical protein YC2023_085079 [Brassica napus]
MDHRGVSYTFGPEKVAEFLIKTIWIPSVMLNRPVYYTMFIMWVGGSGAYDENKYFKYLFIWSFRFADCNSISSKLVYQAYHNLIDKLLYIRISGSCNPTVALFVTK